MPGVHPRTFNAAAKHLFRHLHDPGRLAVNPIARRVFERGSRTVDSPQDARRAVSDLHDAIVRAVERCRDESAAAGKSERARRQYAIVTWHYIERISMPEIAARLGLSVKHCYRQRAEICRRIAWRLHQDDMPAAATAVRDTSGFYFLLDRLVECTTCTPSSAVKACAYLESVAESGQQRIDALDAGVSLSLSFGDRLSAEAAYARASRVYDEHFLTAPAGLQAAAQASIDLAGWRIANHYGKNGRALRFARDAVRRLQRLPQATPHNPKLWVEAHFNLAVTLWARGDLAPAYDALSRAATGVDRLPSASALRLRVEASLWKLRNYLLLSVGTSYASGERIDGLRTAFRRAVELGLLFEAIDALIVMTECHVFAGRDDRALQSVREALTLIERLPNRIVRRELSIDLGVRLLSTRFWRRAATLIGGDPELEMDDAHQHVRTYALALLAFRRGDFEAAWARSRAADNDAYAMLTLRSRILTAAAGHAIGRKEVAREAAASAVCTAECLGAAPLLRDAYGVAANVLKDERLGTRAREVARILA